LNSCGFRTKGAAALAGLSLVAACASTPWKPPAARDSRDDPAAERPGHGDAELRVWAPLTPPEVAALAGLERARQGDAHALLALAVMSSGGPRDAATYARVTQRFDAFVAEVRPRVAAAADDWHRGYELHRAMHRGLFGGASPSGDAREDLSRYEFSQASLTEIFSSGKYNCLSSAMLFVALARAFDMPVRAAAVPTHVFVELGAPGRKIVEIETTSPTGFDWVHDARFYRDDAASWSSRRGLRPVTLEEYEHRRILEPYQLMALALRNVHVGESEDDRARGDELAGFVDREDAELVRIRVQTYTNEASHLYEAKAWRTMAKLFDVTRPAILEIASRSSDAKVLALASWATWYHAYALTVVGRREEGLALVTEGLPRVDPSWEDARQLRDNFVSVVNDRLAELMEAKDFSGAADVFGRFREACRGDRICSGNAGSNFLNWTGSHENTGDWLSARQVLQRCVTELPAETRCRDALADLESRHRF
jgi:Transglutaminase-like superfamily